MPLTITDTHAHAHVNNTTHFWTTQFCLPPSFSTRFVKKKKEEGEGEGGEILFLESF